MRVEKEEGDEEEKVVAKSDLALIREILPYTSTKRQAHNSFVANDYLFLVFGYTENTFSLAERIDCLNLKDKKAEFFQIKIESEIKQFVYPMIFDPSASEQVNNFTKKYFFGGKSGSHAKRKQADSTTAGGLQNQESVPLYELVIHWTADGGSPTYAEIKLKLDSHGREIRFPGQPRFHPNIQNKKEIAQKNVWFFIDDDGNFYLYDTVKEKVRHQDINFDNLKIDKKKKTSSDPIINIE
jgi:hypothetical protein